MELILGGALGNICDRLVMAKIEGYGHILEGRVNDFLYFTYSFNGDPCFPIFQYGGCIYKHVHYSSSVV